MDRKRVGIVIFHDVEVLDFCGPFEVFSVTRRDADTRRAEPSPFEVVLVAEHLDRVVTTGGMKVTPDFSFENCPPLDIVVVPGGWGARAAMSNKAMLSFIRSRAAKTETLASVCTGSLILAEAGLLDGLRATTHWLVLDEMQERYPKVTVDRASHVVEQGKIVTSAGISAGIDMALKVVEQHFGKPAARATARHMEYPYPESNSRRISF